VCARCCDLLGLDWTECSLSICRFELQVGENTGTCLGSSRRSSENCEQFLGSFLSWDGSEDVDREIFAR
jgi:hypothetical protein